MQAKTTKQRLEEASILLDVILDCFEDNRDEKLEDARTFLEEEYWQDMQGGKS